MSRKRRTDLQVGDQIGKPPYRVELVQKLAGDKWLVADFDRPKPVQWPQCWQFEMSKENLLRLRGRDRSLWPSRHRKVK